MATLGEAMGDGADTAPSLSPRLAIKAASGDDLISGPTRPRAGPRVGDDEGAEGTIRILLVEDDAELSARLAQSLVAAGYEVDCAQDGESAWRKGGHGDYDACVLDLGLPHLSGLDVLKKWRASGVDFPVLILSARNSWNERVAGLNLGADDYLGKPFQAVELIARLRAQLRRARRHEADVTTAGGYSIDLRTGIASGPDATFALTGTELRILRFLTGKSGRIVPQSELIEHVYADGESRDSNTVEVYVARLRKRFGKDVIRTVRGLGYARG